MRIFTAIVFLVLHDLLRDLRESSHNDAVAVQVLGQNKHLGSILHLGHSEAVQGLSLYP